MAHAARAGSVDQQYGPLGAAGAGGESFIAVDDIAAVNFLYSRSKADGFIRFTSLRFTAPCDPFLAAFHDTFEPARLLCFSRHAVEQHERVNVTFPAARERHID